MSLVFFPDIYFDWPTAGLPAKAGKPAGRLSETFVRPMFFIVC